MRLYKTTKTEPRAYVTTTGPDLTSESFTVYGTTSAGLAEHIGKAMAKGLPCCTVQIKDGKQSKTLRFVNVDRTRLVAAMRKLVELQHARVK